jgi:hypothetical protein
MSDKSEVRVSGYQSRVLSCIVRRRYQATTSEDIEDLMFEAVICRVCRLVKVLQLFLVTSCMCSVNPITNPNPVSNQ